MAQNEERQIKADADKALIDLLEKHKQAPPRAHVMDAYLASHAAFGPLYKNLAE